MAHDTRLTPADPASTRYVLLVAALGGEPAEPQHRATLARLVAWTSKDDIDTLAHLIREAIEREISPLVRVIADVAEILDGPRHPMSTEGYAVVGLPVSLMRRIRGAMLGRDRGDGDREHQQHQHRTSSDALIAELGAILGGLTYATGTEMTVTLPALLIERVVERAIDLAEGR